MFLSAFAEPTNAPPLALTYEGDLERGQNDTNGRGEQPEVQEAAEPDAGDVPGLHLNN